MDDVAPRCVQYIRAVDYMEGETVKNLYLVHIYDFISGRDLWARRFWELDVIRYESPVKQYKVA